MLTIKEFVKTSLIDIAKGIRDANESVGIEGVKFAPLMPYYNNDSKGHKFVDGRYPDTEIEFDIAVTATTEKDASTEVSGVGVVSAVLGVKGGASITSENSTVSRVKFKIAAVLSKEEED